MKSVIAIRAPDFSSFQRVPCNAVAQFKPLLEIETPMKLVNI